MQKLIAAYLFKYKSCALPQLGTLYLQTVSAVNILGEQKIAPPTNELIFKTDITDSKNFTEFIAANNSSSFDEAATQLKKTTNKILQLAVGETYTIQSVGSFLKLANDKLSFSAVQPAAIYVTNVFAERVIHPNDSHAILVGDTETHKNAMTEYYSDDVLVKKSKWWIWALVFFVIALIAFFIYQSQAGHNSYFGISHKYNVAAPSKTYKSIP